MAKKARSLFKFLLAGLISLIGFTSCSKDEESLLIMYGTPNGSLDIKAKIYEISLSLTLLSEEMAFFIFILFSFISLIIDITFNSCSISKASE